MLLNQHAYRRHTHWMPPKLEQQEIPEDRLRNLFIYLDRPKPWLGARILKAHEVQA